MRLTTRNVPSLEAGEYRDAQVPGLLLRVWDTGRAWAYRYTFGGKRQRVDLGEVEKRPAKLAADIEQARDLARELTAGLVRGEDPRVTLKRVQASGITVAELCAKMLTGVELRAATRADWTKRVKTIGESTIADTPAPALTRSAIVAWGDKMVADGLRYSANRLFEVVRRAFSYGVEKELIDATPFVKLKPPFAGEKARGRFLSKAELVRLIAFLDSQPCGYTNAVRLLLYTAKRKSQVEGSRRLEWDFSDPEKPLWTVPGERKGSKGSPDDHVGVPAQAAAVAREMIRLSGGSHLLPPASSRRGKPRAHGAISTAYVASLKAAIGAEKPWTLHSLRATFATHAQDLFRADLSLIASCLGQVQTDAPESVRVYALSRRVEEKRELLQKWGDWLDSIREEEELEMLDTRAASKFMRLTEATLAQYRSWKVGAPYRVILKRVWYLKRDLEAWKAAGVAQPWPKSETGSAA